VLLKRLNLTIHSLYSLQTQESRLPPIKALSKLFPALLKNSPVLASSAVISGHRSSVLPAVTAYVIELLEAQLLRDDLLGLAVP
jgi:hypothetical protein